MTDDSPRTLDYLILRCCERLHLTEHDFHTAPYPTQLRWLAFEKLRQQEEQ